jgi:hypothetical protein
MSLAVSPWTGNSHEVSGLLQALLQKLEIQHNKKKKRRILITT